MNLTIIGCTFLLCGVILYGFRYVAAAILNAPHQGADIGNAFSWLGWTPTLLMIASFVLGYSGSPS